MSASPAPPVLNIFIQIVSPALSKSAAEIVNANSSVPQPTLSILASFLLPSIIVLFISLQSPPPFGSISAVGAVI